MTLKSELPESHNPYQWKQNHSQAQCTGLLWSVTGLRMVKRPSHFLATHTSFSRPFPPSPPIPQHAATRHIELSRASLPPGFPSPSPSQASRSLGPPSFCVDTDSTSLHFSQPVTWFRVEPVLQVGSDPQFHLEPLLPKLIPPSKV